jgi:large subunit ribosomal protein L10
MLTKEQKRQQSDQLRDTLDGVTTLFLVQNRGLNVNQVNDLRTRVRDVDASYRVFKNSVVKLAVEGTSMEDLSPHLIGPNAIAFTDGDGVALAKVIRDFVKDHPALSFSQAYLEGQIVEPTKAEQVADLPTKDQLVSKLLFMMQSPIRRLAVALNAPIQNLASVLQQIADAQPDAKEE